MSRPKCDIQFTTQPCVFHHGDRHDATLAVGRSYIVSLRHFGTVRWPVAWSREAATDLTFWASVDFFRLEAPSNTDTLKVALASTYRNPHKVREEAVSFIVTDTSD